MENCKNNPLKFPVLRVRYLCEIVIKQQRKPNKQSLSQSNPTTFDSMLNASFITLSESADSEATVALGSELSSNTLIKVGRFSVIKLERFLHLICQSNVVSNISKYSGLHVKIPGFQHFSGFNGRDC